MKKTTEYSSEKSMALVCSFYAGYLNGFAVSDRCPEGDKEFIKDAAQVCLQLCGSILESEKRKELLKPMNDELDKIEARLLDEWTRRKKANQ